MKKIVLVTACAAALVTAAQAAAPSIYPHVYTTRITGASPAALNGTWRLAIQRTTFGVSKGGVPAVAGSVQIAGNKITFHDLAGPLACKGSQAAGTYTWRLAGTTLTMTKVKDTCAGRPQILGGHRFTRVA